MEDIWAAVSKTPSQPLRCTECFYPLVDDTRYVLRDNNRDVFCTPVCAVLYRNLENINAVS